MIRVTSSVAVTQQEFNSFYFFPSSVRILSGQQMPQASCIPCRELKGEGKARPRSDAFVLALCSYFTSMISEILAAKLGKYSRVFVCTWSLPVNM